MLRSKYVIPVIVIGGWLLFGTRVGQRGIWSSHEGRAAQNAWSILDSGNWLIPTLFTDTPDLQKPPLYYCMVAAMAKLGGGNVTGLAVRLPATLAAILGLILVYRLGQRMWGWETGLGAAIILATTTRYAWLARVGRIDMPLTVCCLAALYGFWKIVSQSPESRAKSQKPKAKSLNPKAKSLNPIWSIYLPLALGILLKGPVAAILVLLPVCTFLWITGQPWIPRLQPGWQETWRRFRVFEGLVAVAVLTIPWYAYVVWTTGGIFLWEFGVYHNLERALGTNEALKSGPVWFYFPRLFVDCFPWSLLLPAVCLTLWRLKAGGWRLETGDRRAESGERRAESGKQEFRNFRLSALSSPHSAFQPPASSLQSPASSLQYPFLLSWIVSQFVFLSLVSFKRPDYLLPIFPAVALLLAGWMRDRLHRFEVRQSTRPVKNPRRRARLILLSAYILAGLTAPLLTWGLIEFLKKGVVKSMFKIDLLDRYLNETDHFMMNHLERLLRENWPILVISLVVIVGCVWLLHTGWHNRRNWKIVAGLAIPWTVCYLLQIHLLLPALDELRDMSRFAEEIRTLATEGRPIYYFGKFDDDLVFHAGKPARLVGSMDDLVTIGESSEPVFVVMKSEHYAQFVKNDRRFSNWSPLASNQRTAYGEHRQPRVLLANRSLLTVDRTGSEKTERRVRRR